MKRLSWLLLLAVIVSAPAGAAADAATVTAEAGLGGLSRPGRWTPVRVAVHAANADISGEIILDWGNARAHRAITLSSGSHKEFELYIRTPDVREAITVRLWSNGREIASVDAPVRVARPEDTLTLCVTAANSWSSPSTGCSTTMAPENLPHSWRGYDAADEVVGPSAGAPPFARDQQTALIQWRGVHALEVTGGSPSVSAPDMSATLGEPARLAVLGLMLYILAIAAVGFTLTRTRGRSLMLYPAVGLLVVAGSAAALAAGRVGPGTDVHIQQSVVVQQLPGTASSLILLRGVAEFPAFDTVELRALGADGAVETGESSDRAGVRYDENGAPLLSAGPVGLGARKAFELEAVVDFEALVALRDGRLVRVSNRSQHALDDCQFPAGFSKTRVGSLEPGQSVEAERRFAGGEATFTCSLAVPVVEFAAAHGNVRSDGTAVVMLQLPGDNRP